MATLALGIVGSALGPSVFGSTAFTLFGSAVTGAALGGFIGSTVGALADNFIIFPLLFPPPGQQGPRLSDLQYSSAAEGTDIAWAIGSLVRGGGLVSWLPLKDDGTIDFIEVETEQGGKGGGPSATTYTYYLDLAVEVTETDGYDAVQRLRVLFADSKRIYDRGNVDRDLCEEIVFYDGSQTAASPLIESYEGAGKVPAFKDKAFVTIKRFALDPFGRRIPNFSSTISTKNIMYLDEAFEAVMLRAGFVSSEFDTTMLERFCFRGLVTTGPQPTQSVLASLMIAYAVNAQEVDDGVLRFVPRGRETEITVTEADLAAAVMGDEERRPLVETDIDDITVPGQATVRFYNTDTLKLEQGAEVNSRADWNDRQQQSTLDLPLSLKSNEASGIAQRVITIAEEERQGVTLSLMPEFWYVQAGDVLLVPRRGVIRRVYLLEVTLGRNGIVQCRGFYSDAFSYENDGVRNPIRSEPSTSRTTAHVELNGPPVLAAVSSLVGMYAAAARVGSMYSADEADATTWERLGLVPRAGTFGVVVEAPNVNPVCAVFDDEDSMLVRLSGTAPSSCTTQDCLDGTNRILVGSPDAECEVIGFTTVEDGPDESLRLSGLIRGMNGTEHCTLHTSSDRVIVLKNNASVAFLEKSIDDGSFYRLAAVGIPVTAAKPTQEASCLGQSARSFSPSHVVGEFNTSGDLTLTWQRRSRIPQSRLGPGVLSSDEGGGIYRVELHKYNPDTAARITRTVTGVTTLTVTQAELTAVGLTSTTVRARVYMIGTIAGDSAPGRWKP